MDFMERRARFLISQLFFNGFIFLLVACNHQESDAFISMEDQDLKKMKGVYYYQETPFNGTLFELAPSGDTLELMTIKDGIRNGVAKKWWENGHLKMVANFENGLYEGSVEEWYENGAPFSVFHYKKGKEDGKQTAWQTNGKIKFNYQVIGNRKYGLTGVKHCTNDWVD